MGNLNVTFLGIEYTIPEDVVVYIDLLDFTDSVQKQLVSAFMRKLRNRIQDGNVGLLDNEDLAFEIEQQAGKFIAKLCDNGVFTRTIRDYSNNKGYQYISDVNKAALEKIKSLLMRRLDSLQEGYEGAVQRAESHVTGMGFSIWSGSFVNHAIYAAMQASTINKQEKEASAAYQKEIDELCTKLESDYDRETSQYINNEYIPNMEAAFTVFAYELLDKYVADLIANSKFGRKTLDYVDVGRSNDLLKNLTLSNNKKAILENAFVACPYNIAVYMQAMKYDLLDYESFQTAKVFKQDHLILAFFGENWGEVSFPTKFNINYHCINVWASLTGKTSAELLRSLTDQYAVGIYKAYSRVANILADESACHRIVAGINDDMLLLGEVASKGKAREFVESIVSMVIWDQLTQRCGYSDLFDRIKALFPSGAELQAKKDLDGYVIEQLTSKFEEIRIELVEQIKARRAEEERRRLEGEKRKAEQERIQAEKEAKRAAAIKKGVKRTLIVISGIAAVFVALIIAGIIYLFATDKPIDDDFAQSYEDHLHGLVYRIPENWEYFSDASSDNETWYTRYDNWGNFLGSMIVTYEGEVPDVSVDSVVAEFQDECPTAECKAQNISGKEFSVITFEVEGNDGTPFFYNIFATEADYSVFYITFIFVEKSNKTGVFEEIVGAVAFDDYVNPKEEAYNEALDLLSAEKYDDAISVFTELGEYKDSTSKIIECENAIVELKYSDASRLMASGKYEEALAIFEELNNYKDSDDLIQKCNDAILENKYTAAVELMSNAEFESAITAFESIIDYKDSSSRISECQNQINEKKYNEAVALATNGDYEDAIIIFNALGDYRDSAKLGQKYTLLICDVGDVITLGSYEQDNNLYNGTEKIEWIVLERDGNKALVISKYCLEQMPFNNTLAPVTWENCTIRKWLNNDFLNKAFSTEEKLSILISDVRYPDDVDHEEPAKTTQDRIFLLSENEALMYFDSDSERAAQTTEYVGALHCYWILRTNGSVSNVAHVETSGYVGYYENVDREWYIRPAMWIDTDIE